MARISTSKLSRLIRTDELAARNYADSAPVGRERCIALAHVARQAQDVCRLAAEALAQSWKDPEPYGIVMSAAWPIRALLERGHIDEARAATQRVMTRIPEIEHAGSRTEAVFLLFQATLVGPPTLWKPVLKALMEGVEGPMHWRHARAVLDALHMVHTLDAAEAAPHMERLTDERLRKKLMADIAKQPCQRPRDFV